MTYSQIRGAAKDGDVLFLTVNKNNWLSKLTSWFTQSLFTHAAFVFWYHNRLMVVESTTHGGIRIVLASTYSDRNMELVSSAQPWEDISWKALEQSGTTKYGWCSAAYIGIRDFVFVHFGISLPQDNTNQNKACSEFVAEVLELKDTDITPRQLYAVLSEAARQ